MTPSIDQIQRAVAARYKVSRVDILSRRRDWQSTYARHVAMWIARHETLCSFPEIARAFHKDHTTVLYAVERVERLIRRGRARDAVEVRERVRAKV